MADDDLGTIDDTLDFSDRINWPGLDEAEGRVIPLVQAFGNGRRAAYWVLLPFATRETADSFWFCREDDDRCPLDEHRRLAWDRLVGHPLFAGVPGHEGSSPFWRVWKVTVPRAYQPDEVKRRDTLDARLEAGDLTVAPLVLDFGDWFGERVGAREVVIHGAPALTDTALAGNGGDLPDGSGRMLRIEMRRGWFEGYRVGYLDFSQSDGVFPAADDSEERPLMRLSDLFLPWRRCDTDPRPALCDVPCAACGDRRPVSERSVGQDLDGDGQETHTNAVLGALPCERPDPAEPPYSPLRDLIAFDVLDPTVELIDTSGDPTESDLRSAGDVLACLERGACIERRVCDECPEDWIFFDAPTPVPEGFLPSCGDGR